MSKFIRVHDAGNNRPVLLNTSNISAVETDTNRGKTKIYFIVPPKFLTKDGIESCIFAIYVNENVEAVNALIEDTTK